jgi:uncharacterized membrane protein YdfJ with MMPL/SSD domain
MVASAPFAARLSTILSGGGFSFSGSESVQVSNELIDKLHFPPSTLTVVFQSSTTNVSDPAYQQELTSTLNKIRAFHNVTSVTPGGTGQDGRTTFVNVGFNKNYDYMQKYVTDFRALLPDGTSVGPAQAYLTGQLAVDDALNTTSLKDAEQADATVLPIALLILLVVFGTFSAAILPLIMAIITIPLTLAVIYPIAQATPISSFVASIASVIGLGFSIDYSLFITRRFREELARGRDTREAIAALLFMVVTVAFTFTTLIVTKEIGVGMTVAVLVDSTIIRSLLVPATMRLLGRWNWWLPGRRAITKGS